jgi:hypothetical protein
MVCFSGVNFSISDFYVLVVFFLFSRKVLPEFNIFTEYVWVSNLLTALLFYIAHLEPYGLNVLFGYQNSRLSSVAGFGISRAESSS